MRTNGVAWMTHRNVFGGGIEALINLAGFEDVMWLKKQQYLQLEVKWQNIIRIHVDAECEPRLTVVG